MRIGLFFGSFNPIHKGHTLLAQYLLSHTDLEQIWLVVSPNNPLKEPGSLLPEAIRLQLVEMAVRNISGLHACDREFTLPKPNYTVNTLRALSAEHPDDTFTLIMGSDNMAIFHRWKEHDYIITHYPIIVYPRQGDDIEALKKSYPMMQIVEAPLLPISATEIRTKIADKVPIDDWIDPEVAIFLQKNAELFANVN